MPPVITPGSAAMDGKEVMLFESNVPCAWSVSGDSGLYTDLLGTSGYLPGTYTQAVYVKAVNVTGSAVLTATALDASTDACTISITGVCPTHPSWGFRGTHDGTVLTFTPDSGPADRQEREKLGVKYRCDFQAGTRQAAELAEFLAFFSAHRGKAKNFKFTHPGSGAEYVCYFPAALAEEWQLNNLVGYSTVLQEV